MKKFSMIFIFVLLLQGCWETENGEKIGTIVKLAKEGMFIGTYEAELIRGGMNNGNGSFGKSFHFTVEDRRLLPIINQSLEQQKTIKIKYHSEAFTALGRSEGRTFVDKVEIIK